MTVLTLLAPLLKKRDTWYLLAILVLLGAFRLERAARKADDAIIAARPAVHTEAEQHVQIVRVSGPVRVETRTVFVPGTTQVAEVDRIATREAATTTTTKDSQVKRDVQPACPAAPREPWFYAGAALDPADNLKPRRAELGLEHGHLAGGVDYDWKYHAVGLDARVRF